MAMINWCTDLIQEWPHMHLEEKKKKKTPKYMTVNTNPSRQREDYTIGTEEKARPDDNHESI